MARPRFLVTALHGTGLFPAYYITCMNADHDYSDDTSNSDVVYTNTGRMNRAAAERHFTRQGWQKIDGYWVCAACAATLLREDEDEDGNT